MSNYWPAPYYVNEAITNLAHALTAHRVANAERREQAEAERAYPLHAPSTALLNHRAGREVWDTNGDLR